MTRTQSRFTHAPQAEQAASESSNVFSEFLGSTYDGSIGGAVKSIKQISGINTKDAAAEERPLHGGMRVAQEMGSVTGQFIDFAILSKVCGGVLERSGAAQILGEGALNKAVSSATVGFVHGSLLTPVDETRHEGFLRRLANGSVEGTAFATVGATGSRLQGRFAHSFMGRTKANIISGAAGGAVDGVLTPLSHGQAPTLDGFAANVGSWAFGNALIGPAGPHESAKFHTLGSGDPTFKENVVTGHIPVEYGRGSDQIKYEVHGNDVHIWLPDQPHHAFALPRQVRLLDHTGFIIDGSHDIHGYKKTTLRELPNHVDGVDGRLDYKPFSTTLTTSDGVVFEQWLGGQTRGLTPEGHVVSMEESYGKGDYDVKRSTEGRNAAADRELAKFRNGRLTEVSQGVGGNGDDWKFFEDGSFSSRTDPGGHYQIYVDAEGNGESIAIAGRHRQDISAKSVHERLRRVRTSEGPGERVYVPHDIYSWPVSYNHETGVATGFSMPNITPVEETFIEKMRAARDIMKWLAIP